MLYLSAERGHRYGRPCVLRDTDEADWRREKQLSMKQLEKVLCIAQSTTAGIISRLEQKGLVEGYADAVDKRIKLVRITQAGIDRVLETKRDMIHSEEMLLSGLTETERDILYSLLKKIKDSLK